MSATRAIEAINNKELKISYITEFNDPIDAHCENIKRQKIIQCTQEKWSNAKIYNAKIEELFFCVSKEIIIFCSFSLSNYFFFC